MIKTLLLALVLVSSCYGLSNAIVIHEASGSAQTNRPVSVLMVFIRGEIPGGQYPRPRINGATPSQWQANVMSTWPDGSVLTAFVSFPVTLSANGSVTVDFVPDSDACHLGSRETCESSGLSASAMLDMSWDATISGTANSITYSANARSMISAGAWRYWYRGPVVTRVIVEDMTTALAYDFGWQWNGSSWQAPSSDNYKSAHPIFDIAFWPSQGLAEVGWYLENAWRTRAQTLRFDLAFLGQSGATVYSKTDYALGWRGGVSYYAWQPSTPGSIWIDRNIEYLVATKILPPYDLSLQPPDSNLTSLISQWNSYTGTDDQGRRDPRSCTTGMSVCGYIVTYMPQTGDHLDFGIIPGPHITYLYATRSQTLTVAQKLDAYEKIILGSGDAMVTIPVHMRESYTNMNPPSRNYLMWPDDQQTPSFGRLFSVIAQPDARSLFYENYGAYPVITRCSSNCPADWHPWSVDIAHHPSVYAMPYLLSGRYAYLTTMQQAAAAVVGYEHPDYLRHGAFGILPFTKSNTERIGGRALKVLAWAYLLSPDSPERNYFAKILRNNDEFLEGLFGITNGNAGPPPSQCISTLYTTASVTSSTSGGTFRVNGQQRAFVMDYAGIGYPVSEVLSLTADGTQYPVGVWGSGGDYEWWHMRPARIVYYSGQTPPTSSVTINARYNRVVSPWCAGAGLRDNIINPLAMLGAGGYVSDLGGTLSTIGGSPWMVSYVYMHIGWLRDTEALQDWAKYSGQAIANRWVSGAKASGMPVIYDKLYRNARGWTYGTIQSWADVTTVHTPPATLASSITESATSLSLSCSSCPQPMEAGSYIKVGNEWIEIASHSGTTINIARRGIWGTQPSAHSAGTPVSTAHTRLGNQTGHTYSNLLHNAIAAFPDARYAWEVLAPLFTSGQNNRNTDLRYALVPRSAQAPTNVRVSVSGQNVNLYYNAPDYGACRTAIDPPSPDDSVDKSDGGGSLARVELYTGLAPGPHVARVTCRFGRAIVRFNVN